MKSIKIPRLRWWIAGLLFASTTINYIDRQALSVAAPMIERDLHIGSLQYGNILEAFLLAYTVMYVVSGFLVDRWGTRKSLTIFVSWWSIADMLHFFARSAASLSVFRFLLGVGEPGNYNAGGRIASEWYPTRERAFVNGLINAGACLGAVIAIPMVSWIILHYGWRFSFIATGALGILWLIPWLILYRLPERHPWITAKELHYIQEGSAKPSVPVKSSLKDLIARSETWALMIARFFSDPVWWFYLFWLPSFLQEQRHFTLSELAVFGWIPYLTSDIGGLAGGWVSDHLVRRLGSPVRARMWPMGVCAFTMPVSLLVPHALSVGTLLLILCTVTFAHQAWKTNLMTITNDIYPTERVGSVFGILMVGSGIGGFLFQGITAHLVQHSSYAGVFTIMGFLHPLAFLICYVALRRAGHLSRGTPTRLQETLRTGL